MGKEVGDSIMQQHRNSLCAQQPQPGTLARRQGSWLTGQSRPPSLWPLPLGCNNLLNRILWPEDRGWLTGQSKPPSLQPLPPGWVHRTFICNILNRVHWSGDWGWLTGRSRPLSLQPLPPGWVHRTFICNILNRVHWSGDWGWLTGRSRTFPPASTTWLGA